MGRMVIRMAPQTTPLTVSVAAEIQARMHDAGLSIRDLSTATGIPSSTLQRRLAAHSPFDLGELSTIADVLRVKASEITKAAEAQSNRGDAA